MNERPFRPAGSEADIGVLAEPACSGKTAVVLLNAGAMRRAGPFRLHVHASRRFAAMGFPTLRIDQPGIADHVASARRPQVDVLVEILDTLQRETGCERFVVGGVCSVAPRQTGLTEWATRSLVGKAWTVRTCVAGDVAGDVAGAGRVALLIGVQAVSPTRNAAVTIPT